MRSYDGRGSDTLFSKTILEDLSIGSVLELTERACSSPFSKDEIAAIARTVCRTAEIGDEVSIKILEEEVGESFISIVTVANKLELADKDFALVFVGNVFKCEKYFKAVLMKKLKDKFPKINCKPLTKKPVEGAIKLALENL